MPILKVELLGGFNAAFDHGEAVLFPTKKAQALLAFLSLQDGQRGTREQLASLLWGGSGEEQARQSLRQTLFALRRTLGPAADAIISAQTNFIALVPGSIAVDVLEIRRLAESDDEKSLDQISSLYKGELLSGADLGEESFEDWLRLAREQLRELAITRVALLLEHQQEQENTDGAMKTAFKLLSIDPLQEQAHRALIRIYLNQHRREAALKQYQLLAELLRKRLGVEPDAKSKALYEQILHPVEHPTSARAKQISILVVEDNLLHRELSTAILREAGFAVATCGDGAEALLELGRTNYDLLLLDIDIPVVDGLQVLESIRRRGITTPTIFLTAQAGEESEVRGLASGAADFITKPVRRAPLLIRIQRALEKSEPASN